MHICCLNFYLIVFKLIGSSYRECQTNGTWSGENSLCDSKFNLFEFNTQIVCIEYIF